MPNTIVCHASAIKFLPRPMQCLKSWGGAQPPAAVASTAVRCRCKEQSTGMAGSLLLGFSLIVQSMAGLFCLLWIVLHTLLVHTGSPSVQAKQE